jgi:hypothetical protein
MDKKERLYLLFISNKMLRNAAREAAEATQTAVKKPFGGLNSPSSRSLLLKTRAATMVDAMVTACA